MAETKLTPIITQYKNKEPKLRFFTDKGREVPFNLVRKKGESFIEDEEWTKLN